MDRERPIGGDNRWRRLVDRNFPVGLSVWLCRSHYCLLCRARTGHVYSCSVVRFVSEDGDEQLAQLWSSIHEGRMKKPIIDSPSRPVNHAVSAEVQKRWPALHEWLTAATWEEDGTARTAPTLTLWAHQGQWKVVLRDREVGVVMWLSADNLPELMKLADGLVLTEGAPWRHDQEGHERNGKRVKKSS